MAFDITQKRARDTAQIELVGGDGSPLTDDEGNVLKVTVHGPGSKVWQRADAERRRKQVARVEKARGNVSAALDGGDQDQIDFLVSVTASFDGWVYPGEHATAQDMFRAAYTDDSLGFIRDHVHAASSSWASFTKG